MIRETVSRMKKTKLTAPALTEMQIKALTELKEGGNISRYNSIIIDGLFRRGLIKRRAFGGLDITELGLKVIS